MKRRQFLGTCAAAVTAVAGCGSRGQSPAEATDRTTTSETTTATARAGVDATSRETTRETTATVERPAWVEDRLTGAPLRPPDTPAGTLADVLTVRGGSGDGVRAVFVENARETAVKTVIAVENGGTTAFEPTIGPEEFVAVGLLGAADYSVTVTAGGHEETVEVTRSQYECQQYLTVVAIASTYVDAETYRTDELCSTTATESEQ